MALPRRANTKAWKGQAATDRKYARRKAAADLRNAGEVKRQRTLLRTYPDYRTANAMTHELARRDTSGRDVPELEFVVRKNRDGFGVYRREVVK